MKKQNLSEREVQNLFEYLGSRPEHHGMIIELLLLTGVRTHEVWNLQLEDLDLVNGVLTLWDAAKDSEGRQWQLPIAYVSRVRGKVKSLGVVPGCRLVEALGYTTKHGEVETFKAVLRRAWGVVRKRVFGGNFRVGLHGLRHTFCESYYVKSGYDVRSTQRAMGHKSLSSTERYLNRVNIETHFKTTRGLYDNG
jgi:integrase